MVIIDRTTGIGQAIMENAAPAKIGIVIHADHFSEGSTNEDYILWNNYYEYAFSQHRHIAFYVTATDDQRKLLAQQFQKYMGISPKIVTIPVGSIDELKYPEGKRKSHSLITASRLADEKHVDWLIEAVAGAKTRFRILHWIFMEKVEKKAICEEESRSWGHRNIFTCVDNRILPRYIKIMRLMFLHRKAKVLD